MQPPLLLDLKNCVKKTSFQAFVIQSDQRRVDEKRLELSLLCATIEKNWSHLGGQVK